MSPGFPQELLVSIRSYNVYIFVIRENIIKEGGGEEKDLPLMESESRVSTRIRIVAFETELFVIFGRKMFMYSLFVGTFSN